LVTDGGDRDFRVGGLKYDKIDFVLEMALSTLEGDRLPLRALTRLMSAPVLVPVLAVGVGDSLPLLLPLPLRVSSGDGVRALKGRKEV
jgi:hypothetical protein